MNGYDGYGGDDGYDVYDGSDLSRSEPRRGPRRESDPLEQRLDRWVSAGRQFVDGVSGARPGSRGPARGGGRPGGRPGGTGAFRPADLGRWVEDKLDRLLEDDGDDWREPWQEAPALTPSRRRPLEAISRRGVGRRQDPPQQQPQDWPDDDSFTLPRWQRPAASPRLPDGPPPPPPSGRPLPRSSRRR